MDRAVHTLQILLAGNCTGTLKKRLGGWQNEAPTDPASKADMDILLNCSPTSLDGCASHGLLTMTFDAATQTRKSVSANACMAALHGMWLDELLYQLSIYDLLPPYAELDGLTLFLHVLLRDMVQPGMPRARYLRVCSGGCAQLVCWCTLSVLDASDRVVEVLARRCSPPQYHSPLPLFVRRDIDLSTLASRTTRLL